MDKLLSYNSAVEHHAIGILFHLVQNNYSNSMYIFLILIECKFLDWNGLYSNSSLHIHNNQYYKRGVSSLYSMRKLS